MSTAVRQPRVGALAPARISIAAIPLWVAVVVSRLLIVVVGAITAATASRYPGWQGNDPARLTLHLGRFGNVLSATAVRWDSIHYLAIAAYGYRRAQDTVFFPLYPLLIRVVALVVRSQVVAGVLISLFAFATGLWLLHRLVREELDDQTARAVVLLLAFAPLSFFFSAVYTESLFLALSVGAFYAARHDRWLLACALGAAATLTRVPGILLVVPLAMIWWSSPGRSRRPFSGGLLVLLPLALLAFLFYLDRRGFGLLAPLHNQDTAHEHTMSGPIVTLIDAVGSLTSTPATSIGVISPLNARLYDWIEFGVLLVCVASLIGSWRLLAKPYSIYATLVLLTVIWSALPLTPLRSLDRYALTIFPLWIGAAAWLRQRRLLGPVIALEACLLAFYVQLAALWGFVG